MTATAFDGVSRQGRTWASLALALVVLGSSAANAQLSGRLLRGEEAARLGLKRSWFAQVALDPARSRVVRAILSGDNLFVLTTAGMVQSFNALTGETLWIAPLGNPNYPSLGPTANDQFVALINGSTLYVLDRADGRPVLTRRVGAAPGAAPAMSRDYCFVPMVTGRLEGFPVGDPKLPTWFYQSAGKSMVAPLVTGSSVAWSTSAGYIYVGNAIEPTVRFRLETGSEIVASPAYQLPYVYVATIAGEMFAIHEATGARRWKVALSFPIERAPAAVGDRVFVTSSKPALHAVDAATGDVVWELPGVTQFAAAGSERGYALDRFGALVVLDLSTGSMLDRMPTHGNATPLVNDQTDRLYLVTSNGLIQCLHELGSDSPMYHKPPQQSQPVVETDATPGARPATGSTPSQPGVAPPGSDPFGLPPTSGGGGDPFGLPPTGGAGGDPFGGPGAGAGGAPAGGGTPGGSGVPPGGGGQGPSEDPFGLGTNPVGR
jgi:outer membrane protein assembly factor BamB